MTQSTPGGPRPRRARAAVARLLPLCLALGAALPAHAAESPGDLTGLSLEQLLDVTIVGASKYEQKQSEVAAAVSVITRAEIKAFGWRTLDEALASLPGIHTIYDRQYAYLGTRGFGLPGDYNTRVLLTIDGNRINDAVFDQAYIGRDFPLDLDLIERIEFIPGPGGAVYGQNAMFGVVNVITRRGADLGGAELALAAQGPQRLREGRASWGRRFDNGTDVLVSASALRARGADRQVDFGAAGVSGVAAGLDGERDHELFARLAHGAWFAEFSLGDRRKDDSVGTYLSDPLTPGQYQRDRHLLAQLQYQDSVADNTLHLSGRLFAGAERYTAPFVFDTAPTVLTAASHWHGIELRALATAWANHKLLVGMEYQVNARQDQAYQDLADPANSVVVPGSGWRAGVYVQDEWALARTLTATLGLRLDRTSASTENAASPRVGLIWQAAPETTLKALYGRAHRAPNVFERDFNYVGQAANPALRGEKIDTLELVADHRLDPQLLLRASVYRWSMQHLVTLGVDAASGLPQYQNGMPIDAQGAELSAAKTWGWGGRLRGSVSLQNARWSNGTSLDNSPQLLGKLDFSGPLAATGLRSGFELQYSSRRRAIDGTDLPGYWLSNLNLVADQWAKGLEISLGLYNLFGARYVQPGSRNNWQNALEQDGRSVRLKLAYRL